MAKSLNKSLLDLTNAYLAVEALLQSDVLTPDTRRKLQITLKLLDKESTKLMGEHAEQDKNKSQAAD